MEILKTIFYYRSNIDTIIYTYCYIKGLFYHKKWRQISNNKNLHIIYNGLQ